MTNSALICIFGRIRASELTWDAFKHQVLNPTGADLALFVGVEKPNDKDNDYFANATFDFSIREPSDFVDAAIDLVYEGKERCVKASQIRAATKRWVHYSALIGIYFKWLIATRLRDEGLLPLYDWIIVTRSDLLWLSPHPPLELLDNEYCWLPDGEYHNGLPDRHLVIPSRHVLQCLSMLPNFVSNTRSYARNTPISRWGSERTHLFAAIDSGMASKIRYFPYVFFMIRGEQDSSYSSMGKYSTKYNAYVKHAAEEKLAATNVRMLEVCGGWQQIKWKEVRRLGDEVVSHPLRLMEAVFRLRVSSGKWMAIVVLSLCRNGAQRLLLPSWRWVRSRFSSLTAG